MCIADVLFKNERLTFVATMLSVEQALVMPCHASGLSFILVKRLHTQSSVATHSATTCRSSKEPSFS